jgi:hypothetical protein
LRLPPSPFRSDTPVSLAKRQGIGFLLEIQNPFPAQLTLVSLAKRQGIGFLLEIQNPFPAQLTLGDGTILSHCFLTI